MNNVSIISSTARSHSAWFFPLLHLLCACIAMFGFVPVYYRPLFAGHANFPLLVHIHAAIATAWMILFVIQPILITSNRVYIHKRLGVGAVCTAVCFIPVTLLATIRMLLRREPPGSLETAVFFPQIGSVALFAAFVYLGIHYRKRSDFHKRFMTMATIATLGTPIARVEILGINQQPPLMVLLWNGPAIILLLYDLWLRRKVHPVTAVCFLSLFVMQLFALYLMSNHAWHTTVHRIADWLR